MTEDKPLRLFVAAGVPPRELAWLADQTVSLRERWPEARWAPIDNQHVTLKFLGSTLLGALDEVVAACAAVAASAEPSEIALSGLGVFPTPRRARVLWAGFDDPRRTLAGLAAGLDDRLGPLGFVAEKRSFTPHLTLARFRAPTRVEDLPPLPPARPFHLGAFGLWRSHLSPRGARYEQLQSFAFGDAT